ncbi:MAG: hypothetical protein K8R09_06515 [Desulfobacterales bacterium]|nr:hypothetical protein [Desulfobacterales bacterium]
MTAALAAFRAVFTASFFAAERSLCSLDINDSSAESAIAWRNSSSFRESVPKLEL